MKEERQARPQIESPHLTTPRSYGVTWRRAALSGVYLLLFVVMDRLIFFLPTSYEAPGWYPPTALSVALVMGLGPRCAPLLALGWALSSAVNNPGIILTHNSLTNALGFAVLYGLAGAMLRRLKVDTRLEGLRALGWFLLVTFVADLAGALTGVIGLIADGFVQRRDYWSNVAGWWLGDAIVIAGISPFLLRQILPPVERWLAAPDHKTSVAVRLNSSFAGQREDPGEKQGSLFLDEPAPATGQTLFWRKLETLGMAASVLASIWLAFSYQLSQHLDLLYICFLPVVWIGVRRGMRGVAVGLFAIGVVPLLALRTSASDPHKFLTVQLLLLLLSMTGLAVGALVSEREAAHRKIAAIARRFQSLVEKSAEGVMLLDSEGKILYDAGQPQILSYAPNEFLGRAVFDFMHPFDRPATYKTFSQLRKTPGASETLECRVRHKDSSYRWLEVTATNWFDDPAIGALVLNYRDLTQRKAAEEALRESEARYRELFENAAFGIYRATPEGRLLDVNPAFVRMFGYHSAAEVLTVNTADLWHDPAKRSQFFPLLEERLESGRFEVGELEFRRKDGSLLLARLQGRHVPDAQGRISYFEGFVEDVTERRRLESQLRHSQKMEAVGRLAGGVAHDFNNLLGVILGYSQVMLDKLKGPDPFFRETTEIQKAADRAAYLTRQLLAFSRKQVLQPKVLNLNRIICDMGELLTRLFGEDITLITHLDPTLTDVLADPSQIEQVLMNLAMNARDAMPQGGSLILGTRNVELHGGSMLPVPPGRYALLRITDTGVGMDRETQARIFEPFFTTKPMEQATGLGLATVYGIVKQSGGHIQVHSAPGHGTTFEIYFPAAAVPQETRPESSVRAALRGSRTILLVEDEPALRQLISDVLSARGYTLLEAADGTSALELARSHPSAIHLLLTDIILPGMNGREIAREVSCICPEIRVLFMSGYTQDPMEFGGSTSAPFLQKPFSPLALTEKIHEVLNTSLRK